MLERRETAPYDLVTNLTYAIAPTKEPLNPKSSNTTWHHGNHPEDELLRMGEIGRAIRTSRIQLTLATDHNFGIGCYHNRFYRSFLPKKRIQRMGLVLFAAANAVPNKVIDFKLQQVRRISRDERQRLFGSGELRMQSDFTVKRTLARFTVETGLSYLDSHEIIALDNITDQRERQGQMNDIIGKALPVAFKGLNGHYKEALLGGYLPDVAPSSPAEVARQYVYLEPERFKMFEEGLNVIFERTAA